MRLTIDTNSDSKEDIQRAIRLLSSLLNHQMDDNILTNKEEKQRDIFESDEPLRNLVTMFDSAEKKETKKSSILPPMMEIY